MKKPKRYPWLMAACSLLLMLMTFAVGHSVSQAVAPSFTRSLNDSLVEQLNQATQGTTRISYHSETGKVRFIGTNAEHAISLPRTLNANASPETAARAFLAQYGSLFGLTSPDKELTVMRQQTLEDGRSFVRFQQTYQNIPVLGGEIIVQMSPQKSIISANGEILPGIAVDVVPQISAATAVQNALAKIAKDYGVAAASLHASSPDLWIYNPILLGGPGIRTNALVWRLEITSNDLTPIRELILIDAHLGASVLNFSQIHTAKNRVVYDNNNNPALGLPGSSPVRSEGDGPTGNTDVDRAYDYAGDTYDFFFNEHGRDSLDGAGMTIISTTRYCPNALNCPYANAFWNGQQMVYGDGYAAADDVVGHELTHGVTEFSSNLFYYYQSGAINESFSDLWGEFTDLSNTSGTDTPTTRWQIGEDVPGLGSIRDMQIPPTFNDPDRMTSSLYYCNQADLNLGTGDSGGVHTNSGVNNKAVYLMTDGDTFNGYTVTGLGISKVADLYYEVQTNLLTSAADYADLYDALIQASINLGYSAADQQEIQDALHAVEMNQPPTSCPAPEAPVCDAGTPSNLFFDDIESGSGNWTAGSNSGTIYWFVPQTTSTIGLADPYATSGTGNIWGFSQGNPIGGESDTFLAMNSDVTLPANAYMHFNHSYGFESNATGTLNYDGGVLEYSTNGGSSWNDAGSLITHNGYNGTLQAGNPLGAVQAFTADSRGYISSRLDLSSLAGQNVRFRFRLGTDSVVYDYGWFIDDVRIYTCGAAVNTPPTISGLPDQVLAVNSSKDNAIDLWSYANDIEDADAALTFSITNSPVISAGVSLDSNRYIDINPAAGWLGSTNVTIQVEDSGSLVATDTFQITVVGDYQIYLPVIMKP